MNASAVPRLPVLLLGFALGFCLPASGEEGASYVPGDVVAPIELEDQHGEAARVATEVRWILFSRDMKGGEVLKASMRDQDAESLAALGAVYVADIHQMPALVSRIMAIPKMRERPYRILLDHKGSETSRIPNPEGHATLVALTELRVQAIEHFSEPAALRQHLGIQPEATSAPPTEPRVPDSVPKP